MNREERTNAKSIKLETDTCLLVMYKILSSIVTSRMSHHINANKIIQNKHKGNANNTYGTINRLIINKMVMDKVKLKQRNISTAWIDYKKAFDSVLHDCINETLKIHKFDPITTKFIIPAIQLMAKIFYHKKIYRVNSSCYSRTGNLHQIY